MIKKEIEIIEDYLKKYQYYIDTDTMPPEIEKEVTKKADTLWIKIDDVLSDMRDWSKSNGFDELHQYVSDFINELEESKGFNQG